MTYEEDTKYFSGIAKQKVACKKCGHIIIFHTRYTKLICTHCGHMVYKNDKEEFKDKMKKQMKKEKK